MPDRWFAHGGFNHEKHRVVSCAECHPKAKGSEKTSDVLLPGVESCRNCHKPGLASANCTLPASSTEASRIWSSSCSEAGGSR